MKKLTVGELRKALEGVPDDLEVQLSSDSGVDQGIGEIIIESARYIEGENGWFEIYANDSCENMPDCEPLTDDEFQEFKKLIEDCDKAMEEIEKG